MSRNSKFLNALSGDVSATPPVWYMRQAGRYLPEYRALRAKAGSFLDLCFDSDLASEVTLQPIRRFDLDAAILFADILLIPHALGRNLRFAEGEGPLLDPVTHETDISGFRETDILSDLSAVFETVTKTRASLPEDKAVIGFAGAPWTVATYMLAGRSMKDPAALRFQYYEHPAFITELIDILTTHTIAYLKAQIDAGADAIQLFDTWAAGLPWPVLDKLSIRPLEKIASALKASRPETPIILFPKGVGEKSIEYAMIGHADGLGIDYGMDPSWARANLSDHVTVQGGLDPLLVVNGGKAMFDAAETLLKLFHDVPYVFNLGHGFVPQTPPENVAALTEFIRGKGR
ncbi:MAG: uroporphyrinogen decarboxylase [Marinicaulis sp.]|nr:uroporphyrinogen decarboxylase [Marinicaulis sp.]